MLVSHQIRAPERKDLDAAYAAAQGIRVPKVFESFDEARDFVLYKKGTLIIRTEHPLEREGLSGLNMSHTVSLEDVEHDEEEGGLFASFREFDTDVLDYFMRDWHKNAWSNTRNYCTLNNLDIDTYLADLTHSYWEYISGYNLYVVADPAVSHRYRVFTRGRATIDGRDTTYSLFDGECVVSGDGTPKAILDKIGMILGFYEKIRALFGTGMCWVVEMQLSNDGELYFLQRSAGHQFKPVEWGFESTDESCHFRVGPHCGYGEVIGTTPKEGIAVTLLLNRGIRTKWLKDYKPCAILSSHLSSRVVEQKILSAVQAYIETYPQYHGDGIRDPHSAILPMVRAPLYLHMPDLHDRLPKEIKTETDLLEKTKSTGRAWYTDPGRIVQIACHICSDGREARVNIVKVS